MQACMITVPQNTKRRYAAGLYFTALHDAEYWYMQRLIRGK